MPDEETFILDDTVPEKPVPLDTAENVEFLRLFRESCYAANCRIIRWHLWGPDLTIHTVIYLDEDRLPSGFYTAETQKVRLALLTRLRLGRVTDMQGSWLWNMNDENLLRIGDASPPPRVPGGPYAAE